MGTAPDRRPGLLTRPAGRLVITLLLVAGTVGWRRGQYFSGSLDPVVLAKAGVSALALLLAFLAAQGTPRRPLGTGSLWLLGLVTGASVFGALTHGTLLASGMIALRITVLALAVFLLARSASTREAFTALAWACGLVALAAAVTGIDTVGTGRLEGGLPPLSPNELALLAGIVVLHVAWRLVLGEAGPAAAAVAAGALGVIWATGSRTGLLVLVAAVAVMALHLRRARVGLVVGALVAAAAGAATVLATGVLAGFLERDGDGTSTLESRFIAWDAATTWAPTTWQLVFGGGLSVKIIAVEGQHWDEQPLDSSWVSLLVQAGLLGLLVAAGWALWALRGALLAPRPHRVLFLGVLVFLLGRSGVESGLLDATPALLGFLTVSLLAEGGSRHRLHAELPPGAGAADARLPVPTPGGIR